MNKKILYQRLIKDFFIIVMNYLLNIGANNFFQINNKINDPKIEKIQSNGLKKLTSPS